MTSWMTQSAYTFSHGISELWLTAKKKKAFPSAYQDNLYKTKQMQHWYWLFLGFPLWCFPKESFMISFVWSYLFWIWTHFNLPCYIKCKDKFFKLFKYLFIHNAYLLMHLHLLQSYNVWALREAALLCFHFKILDGT